MSRCTVLFLSVLICSVGGVQFRHQSLGASSNATECVDLTKSGDGTFFTVTLKIGTSSKEQIDVVVDTGSTQLVLWSKHATNSTNHTGKESELFYGSGDVVVEKASDQIEIHDQTNLETIFLIESAVGNAFYDIEGILPLSMEEYNVLHTSTFSICFDDGGGALKLSSSGTTVPATDRWEIDFSGVRVGNSSLAITSGVVLPDTGTTLLLGPLDHLDKVFTAACSEWSKCKGNSSTDFLDTISYECSTDLPDLTFDFGDETVSIAGSSLVIKWEGACYAAFDYLDYDDMWILGLPLFISNEVAFDADNNKVGFTRGSCSGCGNSLAGIYDSQASVEGLVREIHASPRRPTMRRNKPGSSANHDDSPHLLKLANALAARPFNVPAAAQ